LLRRKRAIFTPACAFAVFYVHATFSHALPTNFSSTAFAPM
jgi:hypothetical protein